MDHLYIFATIALTAYAQIVMKAQADRIGVLPETLDGKFHYFVSLLFNPWIISVLIAAFLGMLSWMIALGKFRLSYAYPFYSLIFVIVTLAGHVFFHEVITPSRVLGVLLIVVGVIFVGSG